MPKLAKLPESGSVEGVSPCSLCLIWSLCLTCIGGIRSSGGPLPAPLPPLPLPGKRLQEIDAMMMKQLVLLQWCINDGCGDDELSQFVADLDR